MQWELDDLVGVTDIAKMTGKKKGQVSMWASRRDTTGFPAMLARPSGNPVYSRTQVTTWWAAYQRTRRHLARLKPATPTD